MDNAILVVVVTILIIPGLGYRIGIAGKLGDDPLRGWTTTGELTKSLPISLLFHLIICLLACLFVVDFPKAVQSIFDVWTGSSNYSGFGLPLILRTKLGILMCVAGYTFVLAAFLLVIGRGLFWIFRSVELNHGSEISFFEFFGYRLSRWVHEFNSPTKSGNADFVWISALVKLTESEGSVVYGGLLQSFKLNPSSGDLEDVTVIFPCRYFIENSIKSDFFDGNIIPEPVRRLLSGKGTEEPIDGTKEPFYFIPVDSLTLKYNTITNLGITLLKIDDVDSAANNDST